MCMYAKQFFKSNKTTICNNFDILLKVVVVVFWFPFFYFYF